LRKSAYGSAGQGHGWHLSLGIVLLDDQDSRYGNFNRVTGCALVAAMFIVIALLKYLLISKYQRESVRRLTAGDRRHFESRRSSYKHFHIYWR
jgi:hypothetical protein